MSPMITFLVVLLASFVGAFAAFALVRKVQANDRIRFGDTLFSLNETLRNRDKVLFETLRDRDELLVELELIRATSTDTDGDAPAFTYPPTLTTE